MVRGSGVVKQHKRLPANKGAQISPRLLRDVKAFVETGKFPERSKRTRSREPTSGPVAPWSQYPLPSLNMQSSAWNLSVATNKEEVVRMLERHLKYVSFLCWFVICVC